MATAPVRSDSYMIDPRSIRRREGWNPRFDFGEIPLLAASIAHELEVNPPSGGLINDIRVQKLAKAEGEIKYELIDGDRRLTAVEHLLKKGIEFPHGIPAKVEVHVPKADVEGESRDQLVRMYTANTGKSFLPMEEAAAFERMRKAGMTHKEIEKATGRSHGVIARAFLLLKSDGRLKKAVEEKQISASQAVSITSASRGDPEALDQLITEALAAKTTTQKKAAKAKVKVVARKKAKAEGRKLKIRALTDDQLSQVGAKISDLLLADMAKLGMPDDTNLNDWLKASEADVKLGYMYGVLQGLKAAAGAPVDLIAS